ncbi:MAG: glycosyltransferase [Caldilinea sp. CFX5]|nr:glycosyltransferase [Caldilinea sp. CFX5]
MQDLNDLERDSKMFGILVKAENELFNSLNITVVVCTYNRANLLSNVLQSLCEQTLPPSEYEVIVVDNNSTDHTRDIVHSFRQNHPNVRYVHETQQGIGYARNRGWREAKADYVAYTDDDCKVPAHWLKTATDIIQKVKPSVLGGAILAFYDTPRPPWFRDDYGTHDLGSEARYLAKGEGFFSTSNMIIQRALVQALGGFKGELGHSKNKIAYGEETDLQKRIRAALPEESFYYDPQLYVYHLVRPEKMTLYWLIRHSFADGQHAVRVLWGNTTLPVSRIQLSKQIATTLLRFVWDISYGLISRERHRYPYMENYLYEHSFQYLKTLGKLHEQWQILY